MHFVYVFDAVSRDKLLKLGFTLFKEEKAKQQFVFLYDASLPHCFDDMRCVFSDTMTF